MLNLAFAAGRVWLGFFEQGVLWLAAGCPMTPTARYIRCAVRVLTLQFALRLRTGGLRTLPVTLGLCTYGLALRLGRLTLGETLGLVADDEAVGAALVAATAAGAFDVALGLLALHVTDEGLGFRASGMASRRFTDRFTNRWTLRVITLPAAIRTALRLQKLSHRRDDAQHQFKLHWTVNLEANMAAGND